MDLPVKEAFVKTAALLVREAQIIPREFIVTEAEYLSCLKFYTPVGVFGFYWWFSKLIGLLIASGAAIKVMMGSESSWGGAIQALAAFTIAIFDMVVGLRDADRCLLKISNNDRKVRLVKPTRVARFFFVRHVGNGLIIAGGLAEVFSIFAWGRPGLVWVPVAFLFHLFGGSAFYVGFTNFTNIDRSMLRPILAISIPLLVLLLIALLVTCVIGGGNFCASTIALPFVMLLFFHIWAVGMGHILLGKASGDIWGSYIITRRLGQAYVALTGVFPILTGFGLAGQV